MATKAVRKKVNPSARATAARRAYAKKKALRDASKEPLADVALVEDRDQQTGPVHNDTEEATSSTVAKKKNRSHDWESVRILYVEGIPVPGEDARRWTTLKEVAEQCDVPYQMVRQRSAAHNWADLRTAYQMTIEKDRQRKRASALGKEAVDFDVRGLQVAKTGMAMIGTRLMEIATRQRDDAPRIKEAYERLLAGEKVDRWELWSAINYKEMDGLSRAAETFQRIGKISLGENTGMTEVNGVLRVDGGITVSAKLVEDDSERLGRLLAGLEDAGLIRMAEGIIEDVTADKEIEGPDDSGVIDADIVGEE